MRGFVLIFILNDAALGPVCWSGGGFGFLFSERNFAAPAAGQGFALRGEFLFRVEKEPKDARGRAQSAETAAPPLPPCRPPPRTPHYGERVPVRFCNISGALNLSSSLNSCRATGPWVCKNCRWCGSTSAPGFAEQVFAGPLSAGRSGTGPYIKNRRLPDLP